MTALIARFAGRKYEPGRLDHQATRDEREGLRRALIQPLRVVDDTERRTLLGRVRQQAQRGQADEGPIRSVAGAQTEPDLQCPALWTRQRLEPVVQRCTQLMQAREAELQLGLDARCAATVRSEADSISTAAARYPDPSLALQ